MKNRKTWLYDTLLILGTVVIVVFIALFFRPSSEPGFYAEVKVEGKTVGIYSLKENGSYKLNDGTNTLVIRDGYAMITEANCPDHLCENQGKINSSGQAIVCLPNRLVVTVVGNNMGVDLVL